MLNGRYDDCWCVSRRGFAQGRTGWHPSPFTGSTAVACARGIEPAVLLSRQARNQSQFNGAKKAEKAFGAQGRCSGDGKLALRPSDTEVFLSPFPAPFDWTDCTVYARAHTHAHTNRACTTRGYSQQRERCKLGARPVHLGSASHLILIDLVVLEAGLEALHDIGVLLCQVAVLARVGGHCAHDAGNHLEPGWEYETRAYFHPRDSDLPLEAG